MDVIKLSNWAKKNGYSYRGAYNRFHRGDLPGAFINDMGRIMVPVETPKESLRTIVYARVSSPKQKEDLDRQAQRIVEFCISNGWVVEQVIKEVASGLNDTRPKLQKILSLPYPVRLVCEHKDRLTRFGFNYIDTLLNGEIVIANKAATDKEDLMQDLKSIITSMVARYYGQRRGGRKTKEILEKL